MEQPEPPNPSGICLCGCGLPAPRARQTDRNLGYVRGEPVRFIRGHVGNLTRRFRIASTMWRAEDRGYETLCWAWKGKLERTGYANVQINRRRFLAHRAMHEQEIGPIPASYDVDHLCSQRDCVNPKHLEAVTRAENIRRSRTAKLTAADVALIRGSTLSQQKLASLFGVSRAAISDIRCGRTWK